MSRTVWKRMMRQVMNITFWSCHHFSGAKWFGAHRSVHQYSANGQTNNKSENSGEGIPRNTESAWETSWFMPFWAINLCNSVRRTVIASESAPQVFLKFIGSNEAIIWDFGLCVVVKVFSGKMHFSALHNTNPPTVLQHVSSGAERGHAGNCRWRITVSTCSTPCFI